MSPNRLQTVLKGMLEEGKLLVVDSERMKVMDMGQYQKLKDRVLGQLRDFHQRYPMKSGLSREELRTKLPEDVDVKLFHVLLDSSVTGTQESCTACMPKSVGNVP